MLNVFVNVSHVFPKVISNHEDEEQRTVFSMQKSDLVFVSVLGFLVRFPKPTAAKDVFFWTWREQCDYNRTWWKTTFLKNLKDGTTGRLCNPNGNQKNYLPVQNCSLENSLKTELLQSAINILCVQAWPCMHDLGIKWSHRHALQNRCNIASDRSTKVSFPLYSSQFSSCPSSVGLGCSVLNSMLIAKELPWRLHLWHFYGSLFSSPQEKNGGTK